MKISIILNKLIRLISYIDCVARYSWRFYHWGNRATIMKPDLLSQTRAISIGNRVEIRKGVRLQTIGPWDGKEPKMIIGDGTFIHFYFHCGAAQSVIIGKNVLIAGRVYISDHDHEFDHPELPPIKAGLKVAPVVIEDEVWIGEGAVILKGVTVGRRAVIGANAAETKDVPPYTVVGGCRPELSAKLISQG